MLYGKHAKVLPMLEHTIILGHQLRKQLQPLLHARGVTFATVLFVTQESVMEDDLKAVAHFWSIRLVEPLMSIQFVSKAHLHTCRGKV